MQFLTVIDTDSQDCCVPKHTLFQVTVSHVGCSNSLLLLYVQYVYLYSEIVTAWSELVPAA